MPEKRMGRNPLN